MSEPTQEEWQKRIFALLKNVGDHGPCRGCGKPIIWVLHKNGARAPYNYDGTSHFIDCPKADEFRKKKETT